VQNLSPHLQLVLVAVLGLLDAPPASERSVRLEPALLSRQSPLDATHQASGSFFRVVCPRLRPSSPPCRASPSVLYRSSTAVQGTDRQPLLLILIALQNLTTPARHLATLSPKTQDPLRCSRLPFCASKNLIMAPIKVLTQSVLYHGILRPHWSPGACDAQRLKHGIPRPCMCMKGEWGCKAPQDAGLVTGTDRDAIGGQESFPCFVTHTVKQCAQVGINGFGRIGRLSFRGAWDMPELEIVSTRPVALSPSVLAPSRLQCTCISRQRPLRCM
jgi:hypothetical protein